MSAISGLIELIFDNIYIVVVVLFFLSRLLSNRKPQQKPTNIPTFGGGQPQNQMDVEDEEDDQRHDHEEQRRREIEQRRIEQQRIDQQRMEQRRQLDQQRTEQRRQLERTQSARVQASSSSREATNTPSYEELKREQQRKQALAELMAKSNNATAAKRMEAPRAIQLQPNDLRKAVVWSEILGQPRAKRPIRRP